MITRIAMTAFVGISATAYASPPHSEDRALGMLYGSVIGDAAGGPVEFQSAEAMRDADTPVRQWTEDERLETENIAAYGDGLRLVAYAPMRPAAEPYGQWISEAPAGTATDDTRVKLILMRALEQAAEGEPLTEADLARQFLRHSRPAAWESPGAELASEWLEEIAFAARWELGRRELAVARPPERLWGGIGTVLGQMVMPPIAAVRPGDPEAGYIDAYRLAFFDNADARDLNAACVAGIAAAMSIEPDPNDFMAAWERVERAMRETDPYGYGDVPWVTRSVDLWLRWAEDAVERADRRPAVLRRLIEDELPKRTWWEAHVPFVMAASAIRMTEAHPAAAVRMCLDLGWDTDSTAQLAGAWLGALHGAEVWPAEMRTTVDDRLHEEYGERVGAWAKTLRTLRAESRDRPLAAER